LNYTQLSFLLLFLAGFQLSTSFPLPFFDSDAYPNNTKMWLEARSLPKTKAAQKLALENILA